MRALSIVQPLHPIDKVGVRDCWSLEDPCGVSGHFGHFCFVRELPFYRSVFLSNVVLSPSKDSLRLMLRGGTLKIQLYALSASRTVLIVSRWLSPIGPRVCLGQRFVGIALGRVAGM